MMIYEVSRISLFVVILATFSHTLPVEDGLGLSKSKTSDFPVIGTDMDISFSTQSNKDEKDMIRSEKAMVEDDHNQSSTESPVERSFEDRFSSVAPSTDSNRVERVEKAFFSLSTMDSIAQFAERAIKGVAGVEADMLSETSPSTINDQEQDKRVSFELKDKTKESSDILTEHHSEKPSTSVDSFVKITNLAGNISDPKGKRIESKIEESTMKLADSKDFSTSERATSGETSDNKARDGQKPSSSQAARTDN